MRRIRKFKKGLKQAMFSKPKGKHSMENVYAAHFLNSAFIWAFAK